MSDLPTDYSPRFLQVTISEDRKKIGRCRPLTMQTIIELYDATQRNVDHMVIVSLSDQIKKVTGIVAGTKAVEFVDIVVKDYN